MILVYIQIQADSVVSDFWLRSFDTTREIQIIKTYANNTMLIPATTWGILCSLNSTERHNGRKLNNCLFKILKFSAQSLLGITLCTLQPHFLSGGLLWHMMIFVSFPRGHKTALSDCAPGLKDPSSSKPYQTK